MQYAIIGKNDSIVGTQGAQQNDTILKAIKGESTSHTPVWFMRQAGRSQPEYRKLKENILYLKSHINRNCVHM